MAAARSIPTTGSPPFCGSWAQPGARQQRGCRRRGDPERRRAVEELARRVSRPALARSVKRSRVRTSAVSLAFDCSPAADLGGPLLKRPRSAAATDRARFPLADRISDCRAFGKIRLDRGPEDGWGGRIRTCECRIQSPVPYRLATPQAAPNISPAAEGSGNSPSGGWSPLAGCPASARSAPRRSRR